MMLSIVIPTCNRPAGLEKCLTALSGETGESTELQVIVVDDGSVASAAESMVGLCGQRRFMYVRNDSGKGPASARNTGIGLSVGEWVAFLDDDVCVQAGWLAALLSACANSGPQVVGVEGRTVAGGDGLWDREVQNLAGGLYLSCNIAYRRTALEEAGRFNPLFPGPFCEDHELAARMLRRGTIVFEPAMAVVHQPRRVRLLHHMAKSARRSALALESEYLFWQLQRDRYHQFRSTGSFWHTLLRLAMRQAWISLRRRRVAQVLRHPVQALVLLLSEAIEQVTAVALLPRFIVQYIRDPALVSVDERCIGRTAAAWGLRDEHVARFLRARTRPLAAVFFGSVRRPVYSLVPNLRAVRACTRLKGVRLYLRVDDVFLDRKDDVARLCDLQRASGTPFLAAVTGDDLLDPAKEAMVDSLLASGAVLGLHGFSHRGRFGHFASELLQMTMPEIDARVETLKQRLAVRRMPSVLVPPFNAVSWDQILHLGRLFGIVTGGPETLRFAHRWIGPLALPGGGWYFPSLSPFYAPAREVLRRTVSAVVGGARGHIAVTVHMQEESRDGFDSLRRLVERYRRLWSPWNSLAEP